MTLKTETNSSKAQTGKGLEEIVWVVAGRSESPYSLILENPNLFEIRGLHRDRGGYFINIYSKLNESEESIRIPEEFLYSQEYSDHVDNANEEFRRHQEELTRKEIKRKRNVVKSLIAATIGAAALFASYPLYKCYVDTPAYKEKQARLKEYVEFEAAALKIIPEEGIGSFYKLPNKEICLVSLLEDSENNEKKLLISILPTRSSIESNDINNTKTYISQGWLCCPENDVTRLSEVTKNFGESILKNDKNSREHLKEEYEDLIKSIAQTKPYERESTTQFTSMKSVRTHQQILHIEGLKDWLDYVKNYYGDLRKKGELNEEKREQGIRELEYIKSLVPGID